LDVGDHVAHACPGWLDVAWFGGREEIYENNGLARGRDRAGVVERFQLFELLLDPLRDLPGHLVRRGARPVGLHHHGLDGEIGIFLAPQLHIGERSRQQEDDHEIPEQRATLQSPVGKIELAQRPFLPSIRTTWPSLRRCTPAVTTRSPRFNPPRTIHLSSRSGATSMSRSETFRLCGSTTKTRVSSP